MSTLTTRTRGLLATVALCAFIAGIPGVLLVIDAVPQPSAFAWARLTAPDDGSLALEFITIVCWLAWATFTGQVLASISSAARGMKTPRLLGLAAPQLAADHLVAAAALLFVAVPATAPLIQPPTADAAAFLVPDPAVDTAAETTRDSVAEATGPQGRSLLSEPESESYTVKRGDSLWRIAEERLGDGRRYVELVALNATILEGRPDFLLPSTVLKVPGQEPRPDEAYVVQPGDTLSQIAAEQLDDPDSYPAIVEASRDTVQPDGRRLGDPDLIVPGWHLTIPSEHVPHADTKLGTDTSPAPSGPTGQLDETDAGVQSDRADGAPDLNIDGHTDVDTDIDTDPDTVAEDEVEATPGLMLPGLAGAGAILAGSLWIVLRNKRRTQLRYRRPGTILASPPDGARAAEKSAQATAAFIAPRIEYLDKALRGLTRSIRVVTASLSDTEIAVELAETASLPTPWRGSATSWSLDISQVPEPDEDTFPPYPMLVSVGQADDGALTLINLEELRTISVTGDDERTTALARHIAAELAVNPWSIVTTVDLLGLGADLASFNLGRVRTHPAGDSSFLNELTEEIAPLTVESIEPEEFNAVIIATAERPEAEVTALTAAIANSPAGTGAALIDLAAGGVTQHLESNADIHAHIHVSDAGRLEIPALGIDVVAAGLSSDEARACALLVDLTLDSQPVPMPRNPDVSPVADVGGAVIDELTEPRTADPSDPYDPSDPGEPAGPESVLPLAASLYADQAATTVEEIDDIAPVVTASAREHIESSDPDLDEDLARWESPILASTKLTLLGPVGARTMGDAKGTSNRRPFYVELLAYLVLHPAGATGADLADVFGLTTNRVRVDMSQLRRWLGRDPHTGRAYLPSAAAGPDPDAAPRYRLDHVLCDADLFRRLRTRGQARGADGIEDLIAALRLVSGEPFTGLRDDHWTWLLDGDRWDHIMTSAIVDVAHIVTTHALAVGDPELATWSSHVAYTASPYDEVAQLDVIAAARANGDADDPDEELRDKVLDRRDDELAPIELPPRTARIVGDKGWASAKSRRRRTG